jgi:hypothetical protein
MRLLLVSMDSNLFFFMRRNERELFTQLRHQTRVFFIATKHMDRLVQLQPPGDAPD